MGFLAGYALEEESGVTLATLAGGHADAHLSAGCRNHPGAYEWTLTCQASGTYQPNFPTATIAGRRLEEAKEEDDDYAWLDDDDWSVEDDEEEEKGKQEEKAEKEPTKKPFKLEMNPELWAKGRRYPQWKDRPLNYDGPGESMEGIAYKDMQTAPSRRRARREGKGGGKGGGGGAGRGGGVGVGAGRRGDRRRREAAGAASHTPW